MLKRKVIGDVLLNIIAAGIPVFTLQILIFPYIGENTSSENYGLIIALYSLFGLVSGTIGTSLNNIRLIHDKTYKDNNYSGDFKLFIFGGCLINIVVMTVGTWLIEGSYNYVNIILILIVSTIAFIHDYLNVEFRINLNYRYILYDRLFLALGYGIGFLFFVCTGFWLMIFLAGELARLVFLLNKCTLWKEPLTVTPFVRFTFKEWGLLLVATVLLRITTYADKLILYPLLGGKAVTIYFAATILSKVLSMAITPINSVALSYLSRIQKKPTQLFWRVFFVGTIISFLGYFIILLLTKPILSYLYPQFLSEALNYVYVTTAITMTHLLSTIIQPFVLKFSKMKYQIYINTIDVVLYISLSIVLLFNFGLMGFCYGILISRVFKIIILLLVYTFTKVDPNINVKKKAS